MIMRGLFVTGTDTGVGKTAVSAALMIRYRGQAKLRYWKPVQTGIEQDDDTATVRRLAECPDSEILANGIRLPRPLSPHLSARLAGQTVRIGDIIRMVESSESRAWIVEGAGGVLVPLNDSELMIDLMARLDLPAIVATRSSLGTINHTLLTLEALRSRGIPVAGVVMVGEKNPENRAAIETYGNGPVLGEMPIFPSLTAQTLAAWTREELDPNGKVLEFLHV